ncbi:hypothetical protein MMC07_000955 [Pseudocyphellaria aurata]|nr:hypothetical protein [Pseudocyphellaria aurata]
MTSEFSKVKTQASLSSTADSNPSRDLRSDRIDKKESLQSLRQRASEGSHEPIKVGSISLPFRTNEARVENKIHESSGDVSESGSISSPLAIRVKSGQGWPESIDARFISPKSIDEAEALEAAIGMSQVHFLNLTGTFAPSPPPFECYMRQWRFLQGELNYHWIRFGLSGDPPRLFILDPWSGRLEDWKYPNERDTDSSVDGQEFENPSKKRSPTKAKTIVAAKDATSPAAASSSTGAGENTETAEDGDLDAIVPVMPETRASSNPKGKKDKTEDEITEGVAATASLPRPV